MLERLTGRSSSHDSPKRQTGLAAPAKPGGLPRQLVTAALGYLVLIGIPWAAASYWVSHRVVGVRDRLEQIALGFAGVGVATWAVWVTGQLLGLHPVALVGAPIIVSGILVFDAKGLPRSTPALPRGGRAGSRAVDPSGLLDPPQRTSVQRVLHRHGMGPSACSGRSPRARGAQSRGVRSAGTVRTVGVRAAGTVRSVGSPFGDTPSRSRLGLLAGHVRLRCRRSGRGCGGVAGGRGVAVSTGTLASAGGPAVGAGRVRIASAVSPHPDCSVWRRRFGLWLHARAVGFWGLDQRGGVECRLRFPLVDESPRYSVGLSGGARHHWCPGRVGDDSMDPGLG